MTANAGLILGIILGIVLIAYVFWPENAFAVQRQKTRLDYLGERKEQLYENLRDLNFEYKAGKYPDEDYAMQRNLLEAETAAILAEMDAIRSRVRVAQ